MEYDIFKNQAFCGLMMVYQKVRKTIRRFPNIQGLKKDRIIDEQIEKGDIYIPSWVSLPSKKAPTHRRI